MTNFYRGKNALVIGGAGFIGVHLVQSLLTAGANVTVLDDNRRGKNKLKNAWYLYGDCSVAFADYDFTCYEAMRRQNFIFNLAATVASVAYNQSNHVKMFTENLAAQTMPLRAMASTKFKRYLNVSSVCVYSPTHNNPCREPSGHLGQPSPANEGYALAKRMGEKLAMWYAREHGLHTVIVRPSNVYGPDDHFDDKALVIPALIRKCFSEDSTIIVNGTGQEKREFLYVTDAAEGMVAALEHGKAGEAYNIGTDGETCVTIEGLLQSIQRITGTKKPVEFIQQFDSGDSIRWSDCAKARDKLNFSYQTSLQRGLEDTIKWYKDAYDK